MLAEACEAASIIASRQLQGHVAYTAFPEGAVLLTRCKDSLQCTSHHQACSSPECGMTADKLLRLAAVFGSLPQMHALHQLGLHWLATSSLPPGTRYNNLGMVLWYGCCSSNNTYLRHVLAYLQLCTV